MPRATNERLAASRAIGCLALIVKNIANIAVFDTCGERDLPGALQGCRGGSWLVRHSEIWMERREVKRHRISQIFENPITELLSFFGSIVLVGDHQICDLEPDVSFILKPLEGIEHRIEVRKCNLVVETLCKGFQIHVGCVDVAINLRPCLGRDVTRCYHHALYTLLPGEARNINNKFPPDHRVVVSKRNTRNLVLHCQLHDLFWARTATMRFVELGLADAPVLAKAAAEIAARGAEAQDTGPR